MFILYYSTFLNPSSISDISDIFLKKKENFP